MQQYKEVKVSIIVPIYNGDRYVKECIDSLLCQTHSNTEVILVNDGSTDHSLEICCEYARLDKRISVIDQENKGVTMARKAGLDVATGEYIYFVDCDDWLEEDAVEMVVKKAIDCKADMVVLSGYICEDGDNSCREVYASLEEGVYDIGHKKEVYDKIFYLGRGGVGDLPSSMVKAI